MTRLSQAFSAYFLQRLTRMRAVLHFTTKELNIRLKIGVAQSFASLGVPLIAYCCIARRDAVLCIV